MDDTQRFAYGLKFENAFLRERGKAFETLFARIMAHAFPGDFQPVRPYGPKGDLKCDGFRASDGTVFQCYAPDAMKLEPLLAKVDEDFAGALVHWTTKMLRWEFVHNDIRGLPAEAVKKLAALNAANPNVALAVCGEAELRLIAMSLALHQLEDLFGAVPSGRVLEKLDFEALRSVLLAIQRQEPDAEPSLVAPSAAKLERNALSQDAAGLLRQGRRREQLVEAFFAGWPDPDLGEEIAQAFRVRYQALKAVGLSPDDIFGELQAFAGGMTGEPARQGAVLAVLSYFFERCDIFEDAIRIDAI
ncbi:ABC-three component system protein [Novosphingobium huizhouense]|uniref:ABC-three component system protein n=1 Tax=Novosphingobium huizhouense TaxID=2866625 RepID=UPI001CD8B836|nr:ABC-three component system protein [Novosphingobium huizhouense]